MVAEISGAVLLLGLLCPVSMGVMMWFMAKGMGGHKSTESGVDAQPPTLAELKTEQARLAEKIETLERVDGQAAAGNGAGVEDAGRERDARSEPSSVGTG